VCGQSSRGGRVQRGLVLEPLPVHCDLSGVAAVVLLQAVHVDAGALVTEGSPVQAAGPAAAGVGFPIAGAVGAGRNRDIGIRGPTVRLATVWRA
jgi:hypothetical protein